MRRIYERARSPKGVREPVPQIAAIQVGSPGSPSPASAFFQTPATTPAHEVRVLGLPGANRCVNFIANGVAGMTPLKMVDPNGKPIAAVDTPSVVSRPNALFQPFEFFHQVTACAVMHGNFVGLGADYDPYTLYPRQVVPVPLEYISECRFVNGALRYVIAGEAYGPLDVVHVRGYTMPGNPWGLGVVEAFRLGLTGHLEQAALARDTYKRGAVPSGLLKVPYANPTNDQIEDIKTRWESLHNGSRTPAYFPMGWDFTPLQWTPEDVEFLSSRLFSIAEMALMFGLDPSDIGASFPSGGTPTLTYANQTQRTVARITDAYMPWGVRIEQAWSDLVPGANACALDPVRLLRSDPQTQAEVDAKNILSGVEMVDEARARYGRPPLPTEPVRAGKDLPGTPAPDTVDDQGETSVVSLDALPAAGAAPATATVRPPVNVPAHTRRFPGSSQS